MMMLVQIAVGAMVLYGALLIYDGLLLAYRTGFGRANLLIMLAGVLAIAFFCVMGALAAGIGNPLIAFIVIGASFSALVFLAGFIGYAVATAVLIDPSGVAERLSLCHRSRRWSHRGCSAFQAFGR